MDPIADYISRETSEKRAYLIDFYKRVELIKAKEGTIDLYNFGLKDDRRFWEDINDSYPLPDEKCPPKKPKIGGHYQATIPEWKLY